jgi:hypothetical protein
MSELEKLLSDLSNNVTPIEELEIAFNKIAKSILNDTILSINGLQYSINEIEFYFSSEFYQHIDTYAHSNQYNTDNVKRQGSFGLWYFHRFKSTSTYIKQKFRGLDLTFGNKELGNYGGILMRKIRSNDNHQFIEGISKIVTSILENIDKEEFEKIATNTNNTVFTHTSNLYLTESIGHEKLPIFKCGRVIPRPYNEDDDRFYNESYRYFNHPIIEAVY